MAAPHGTGVAALVYQMKPEASAAQVKRCIVEGAQNRREPVSNRRPEDARTSYPVLTADAAVACIKGETNPVQGELLAPTTYGDGGGSYTGMTALADLNGDGRTDIVVGRDNFDPGVGWDSDVKLLFGVGNGTFTQGPSFATGLTPIDVAVGDLNGDGRLDIATANSNESFSSVLYGDGHGAFDTRIDYEVGYSGRNVKIADINGDGRKDLLVNVYTSDGYVSVMIQRPDGTLAPKVDYEVGPTPTHLTVADLNNDMYPDIISNGATILLNNGDGTFAARRENQVPTFSIAVADVNSDGKPDIVAATVCGCDPDRAEDPSVSVMLGNGDGTFRPRTRFALDGPTPQAIAAGDINGDGRMDVVVADYNVNYVLVLTGDGTGAFSSPVRSPEANNTFWDVDIADLNNDHKLDVVGGLMGTAVVFLHK